MLVVASTRKLPPRCWTDVRSIEAEMGAFDVVSVASVYESSSSLWRNNLELISALAVCRLREEVAWKQPVIGLFISSTLIE
jgi:hypothetical protein